MSSEKELSPEMATLLRRYTEIQREEQRLHDEKAELQGRLADWMEKDGMTQWWPELDGQRLKVRYRHSVAVFYDEEKLKSRLGDRYRAILDPDIRKIRRNLKRVGSALEPFLDEVGTPAPERVREAIEKGLVKAEEFAGAFEKKTSRTVFVGRARDGDDAPGADEAP